jgi:hypothetical protein
MNTQKSNGNGGGNHLNTLMNANRMVRGNQKSPNAAIPPTPAPNSANKSKNEKEQKSTDWKRFRKLYSFFILLVILYVKRPNLPDDTLSTLLQLLNLSFTEENYMSKLDEAMKMIFPNIVGATNANQAIIQVRENKDATFQARIMNAMKVMFNVSGFMDIYQKMYQAEPQIQNNKEFFMTFQSLVNLGQSTYNSDANKILLFLMEPNGGSEPLPTPSSTNNGSSSSLLSNATTAITNIAGKVSSSIQLPFNKLSPEKMEKLSPFRDMLQKVSADFMGKSIYRRLSTPSNLSSSVPVPVPIPNASTPLPVPNASTPLPVPNASTPLPVPNASTPLPVPNASTPLPVPNAATPAPVPNTATSAPVKGGGKVKLNRSNPNSKSFSRVSLRKLWELSS